MKVTIDKSKKKLIIECDLSEPSPSKSGKSMNVFTTNGNVKTDATYEGQPLTVGLNVYYPNPERSKK